jgi:hypothetical protein
MEFDEIGLPQQIDFPFPRCLLLHFFEITVKLEV